MEKEHFIPVRKILQKPTILEMKNELNEYFNKSDNKVDFLEYLEFEFLPERKIKIKVDADQFSNIKMPLIRGQMYHAESKTEYIEKWIQEKGYENNLSFTGRFSSSRTFFIRKRMEVQQIFKMFYCKNSLFFFYGREIF